MPTRLAHRVNTSLARVGACELSSVEAQRGPRKNQPVESMGCGTTTEEDPSIQAARVAHGKLH